MLASLLIVMRETLEAVFIFGLLFALTNIRTTNKRWVVPGVVAGLSGSLLYATCYDVITEAMEGTGQEVLMAGVHGTVALLCLIIAVDLMFCLKHNNQPLQGKIEGLTTSDRIRWLYGLCIAFAMSVEAGEVLIYLSEQLQLSRNLSGLIYGALLGFGIGASVGFLVWAILITGKRRQLMATLILLMLLASGLASQSISFLAQAGLVDEGKQLFNLESLLSESSIPGQILYALFGYESSPTMLQFTFYIATLVVGLLCFLFTYFWGRRHA